MSSSVKAPSRRARYIRPIASPRETSGSRSAALSPYFSSQARSAGSSSGLSARTLTGRRSTSTRLAASYSSSRAYVSPGAIRGPTANASRSASVVSRSPPLSHRAMAPVAAPVASMAREVRFWSLGSVMAGGRFTGLIGFFVTFLHARACSVGSRWYTCGVLLELRIENLLLIERAELRPGEGLTAITGETGAGKTVLAHALDLLLGGKPRAGIVRPGAAEAYVEGVL